MEQTPSNSPTTHVSPVQKRRNTMTTCGVILILLFLCCCGGAASLLGIGTLANTASQASQYIDLDFIKPEIQVLPENQTEYGKNPEEVEEDYSQLDSTFRAFGYLPEDACVFIGGVTKPWSNGPKNLNYAGIINQETQESGFSMQAYIEHWTKEDIVVGYEYPKGKVEVGNDGGIQIEVCNIDGQLYVFMPDRSGESDVPFHQVSFTQLIGKKLLVCYDDDGKPGDWNGDCDGATDYIIGIPIEDFVIPDDLILAWNMMEDMLYDLPGNYRNPAYGEMLYFWINQ